MKTEIAIMKYAVSRNLEVESKSCWRILTNQNIVKIISRTPMTTEAGLTWKDPQKHLNSEERAAGTGYICILDTRR